MDLLRSLLPTRTDPNDDEIISIKLQNDLLVVRPPSPNEHGQVNGSFDASLSGRIVIQSRPWKHVKAIGLAVVTTASAFGPDERSTVVFEKQVGVDLATLETRVDEDESYLRHGIEFDIALPCTLPTHELSQGYEVVSRIWAIVSMGVNSTSSKHTTGHRDRSIESGDVRSVKRGKFRDIESSSTLNTKRWNGTDAKIRSSKTLLWPFVVMTIHAGH